MWWCDAKPARFTVPRLLAPLPRPRLLNAVRKRRRQTARKAIHIATMPAPNGRPSTHGTGPLHQRDYREGARLFYGEVAVARTRKRKVSRNEKRLKVRRPS